jgi:PadR family transcriptional regulator, regulatory protein PadR
MWHSKGVHGEDEHGGGRHEAGKPEGFGGRRHGFVQPWLLLQLAKRPAHGYELMEGLAQQEDAVPLDPGSLYRLLRMFEEEGLVRSQWESGASGPARRVYELTDQGLEYLHTWAATVRRNRARLDRFLADYERFCGAKGSEQQ